MNRTALGWLVAAMLLVGGAMLIVAAWDDTFGGVLVRSGVMLGAVWLALPRARELSQTTWAGIAVFGIVLVARPRLILWGFLASLVITIFGVLGRLDRRKRPPSSGR